jgi:hypothetical protein
MMNKALSISIIVNFYCISFDWSPCVGCVDHELYPWVLGCVGLPLHGFSLLCFLKEQFPYSNNFTLCHCGDLIVIQTIVKPNITFCGRELLMIQQLS